MIGRAKKKEIYRTKCITAGQQKTIDGKLKTHPSIIWEFPGILRKLYTA
jgi:hypothetical protein